MSEELEKLARANISTDELEALRAKVADFEASRTEDSELNELTSEVRSSGKGVSRTIIVVVVALIFGSIIGKLLNPSPTAYQRECAYFNIECSP